MEYSLPPIYRYNNNVKSLIIFVEPTLKRMVKFLLVKQIGTSNLKKRFDNSIYIF